MPSTSLDKFNNVLLWYHGDQLIQLLVIHRLQTTTYRDKPCLAQVTGYEVKASLRMLKFLLSLWPVSQVLSSAHICVNLLPFGFKISWFLKSTEHAQLATYPGSHFIISGLKNQDPGTLM